jgi:hypothetical protein
VNQVVHGPEWALPVGGSAASALSVGVRVYVGQQHGIAMAILTRAATS